MNFRVEKKNKFSPIVVKIHCGTHGLVPAIDLPPNKIACYRCEELRFNGGKK